MSIAAVSLRKALDWIEDGRPMAVATLVETEGSSPLEVGAMMVIDADENIEGSVTGGCVEGALVQEAAQVLSGAPPRRQDLRHQRRAGRQRRADVRRHSPRVRRASRG